MLWEKRPWPEGTVCMSPSLYSVSSVAQRIESMYKDDTKAIISSDFFRNGHQELTPLQPHCGLCQARVFPAWVPVGVS